MEVFSATYLLVTSAYKNFAWEQVVHDVRQCKPALKACLHLRILAYDHSRMLSGENSYANFMNKCAKFLTFGG